MLTPITGKDAVPEHRIVEVLKSKGMNENEAFAELEEELKRKSRRIRAALCPAPVDILFSSRFLARCL